MASGALRHANYAGVYWAETAYPTELYADYLGLYNFNIAPSDAYERWLGFAVWMV